MTSDGVLDLDAFRLQLMQGKGRALVSVMAANNETGAIQDRRRHRRILATEGGEGALAPCRCGPGSRTDRRDHSMPTTRRCPRTSSADRRAPARSSSRTARRSRRSSRAAARNADGARARRTWPRLPVSELPSRKPQVSRDMQRVVAHCAIASRRSLRRCAPDAVIFGGTRVAAAQYVQLRHSRPLRGDGADRARSRRRCDHRRARRARRARSRPSHVLAAMGVDGNARALGAARELRLDDTEEDVEAAIASLRRLIAQRAARALAH